MSYKEKFIEIYNAKIKRQGAKELLAWLEKQTFLLHRQVQNITVLLKKVL